MTSTDSGSGESPARKAGEARSEFDSNRGLLAGVPASRIRTSLLGALRYAVLLLWAGISIVPLLWLASEASKPPGETLSVPISFIPSRFELLQNVVQAFQIAPLARYFANSLLIVTVLATTDILISSMAGYAIAKFRFPGRHLFFLFILGTMMISFMVIVVPLYILVARLGWLDTYWGLMAPAYVSAFGVFFMRQYMRSIPNDYLDAARIDGATEPAVYARIILPMIKPAIATLVIFRFLWEWDSLLWPLVVVNNPNLRTVPLGLTVLADQIGRTPQYSMSTLLAACLVVVLPVLLVFLLLQRQFVNAMVTSGLKL